MNSDRITSLQNPKIKNVIKLRKASERSKQNLFTIEGIKEIQHAIASGFHVETVFYCPEIAPGDMMQSLLSEKISAYAVTKDVFSKIAYREDSGGMLLLAHPKQQTLENIKLSDVPLVIVLESVEKPGNLGAILRTADAAGVDAVILCDGTTDFYNPNVIRASIGCVFSTQIVSCPSQKAMDWLKKNNIRSFATHIETNNWYHQSNYQQPSAIIMGTEATGLTRQWIQFADEGIMIPMLGINDSLNVSIATAVVVYEAMRQRNFKI